MISIGLPFFAEVNQYYCGIFIYCLYFSYHLYQITDIAGQGVFSDYEDDTINIYPFFMSSCYEDFSDESNVRILR